MASDKSFKKVAAQSSLRGQEKRKYLVSGKRVSLRLWENEPPHFKEPTKRSYETVGYVISGRAELKLGGKQSHWSPEAVGSFRQTRNIPIGSWKRSLRSKPRRRQRNYRGETRAEQLHRH